MQAAIVTHKGQSPTCGDFAEPTAQPGQELIDVSAAALSHVTRSRAVGTHYSGAAAFPFVAGVDGVGRRGDGRRVYFLLPPAPFGAMAERCAVDAAHCIDLPDALDDATAAAIAIPGMSSWAALTERARLVAGETVLVNGATGVSGRLAVQIARLLGARRVIATGRNRAALRDCVDSLGADAAVDLNDDPAAVERALHGHFRQGVDVVLDYLWGPSAEQLMAAAARAGADAVPVRHVQIGAAAAAAIALPAAALRASALVLMGSGIGSIALPQLLQAIAGVLQAALPHGLRVRTSACPLRDVASAWANEPSESRTVIVV